METPKKKKRLEKAVLQYIWKKIANKMIFGRADGFAWGGWQ